MSNLRISLRGVKYISGVDFHDLIRITNNAFPICDCCSKSLIGDRSVVIIPVMNYACCSKCGREVLGRIQHYSEDAYIEEKRVNYYIRALGNVVRD